MVPPGILMPHSLGTCLIVLLFVKPSEHYSLVLERFSKKCKNLTTNKHVSLTSLFAHPFGLVCVRSFGLICARSFGLCPFVWFVFARPFDLVCGRSFGLCSLVRLVWFEVARLVCVRSSVWFGLRSLVWFVLVWFGLCVCVWTVRLCV